MVSEGCVDTTEGIALHYHSRCYFLDINLHVGITQGRYRDVRPSSGFRPTQLHQPLQFEQIVDLEIDYLLEL